MKNQYFGDINDYHKFGLLRQLVPDESLTLCVCWMLTQGDDGGDGRRTGYLLQPCRWQDYDPDLFDALRHTVLKRGARDVGEARDIGLHPATRFYIRLLTDSKDKRAAYFEHFLLAAAGCDLVFFDPDNGLEIPSVPAGRKNSSKYLYWEELQSTYGMGASVLVYQHFPRQQRQSFLNRKLAEIREYIAPAYAMALCTKHVAFFLLAQEGHVEQLTHRIEELETRWPDQIWRHVPELESPTLRELAEKLERAEDRIATLEHRIWVLENPLENRSPS